MVGNWKEITALLFCCLQVQNALAADSSQLAREAKAKISSTRRIHCGSVLRTQTKPPKASATPELQPNPLRPKNTTTTEAI